MMAIAKPCAKGTKREWGADDMGQSVSMMVKNWPTLCTEW